MSETESALKRLDGKLFANLSEASRALRYDRRTIQKAIDAGEIPAVKVGSTCRIPTAWIREMAGFPVSEELAAEIREGTAAAERGEAVDLGNFAQYGNDEDTADETPAPGIASEHERAEAVVGQRVRERREALGLTQEQFGNLLEPFAGKPWSRQAVCAAEKGDRSFGIAEVTALASALRTTVGELLGPLLT